MNGIPDTLSSTDKPILISFDLCPFVQRSAILLAMKAQPFERIDIDLNNKPQWFLDIAPTGKVPVLVVNNKQGNTPTSTAIFESTIINEYLDERYGSPLHPKDLLEKAKHRSWISLSESLLFLQYHAISAVKLVDATNHLNQLFKELLKLTPDSHGYYEGNTMSLVDVAFAPLFTRMKWTPSLLDQLEEHAQKNETTKNLLQWINNIRQLDVVVQSVPSNFEELYVERLLSLDSAILTSQLQFA